MTTAVNIITGALGAGKTTLIESWLRTKPSDERWAVLINEVGAVGVDGSLLPSSDTITVREVAGGCMCCATALPSQVALVDLLRRVQPSRVLIEPSGLGHPAAVLDMLATMKGFVDVRATITLVDPRQLRNPRFLSHAPFVDQAQLADVLVATHDDLLTADEREDFLRWAGAFFPAKANITFSDRGKLAPALLDSERALRFVASSHSDQRIVSQTPVSFGTRFATESATGRTVGYVVDDQIAFDAERIGRLFASGSLPGRAKGIFRIAASSLVAGELYLAFQRNGTETSCAEISARGGSRFEVIAFGDECIDLQWLEEQLLSSASVSS